VTRAEVEAVARREITGVVSVFLADGDITPRMNLAISRILAAADDYATGQARLAIAAQDGQT
jgi:hypothetical protein